MLYDHNGGKLFGVGDNHGTTLELTSAGASTAATLVRRQS